MTTKKSEETAAKENATPTRKNNLRVWDRLSMTDPKHTKRFKRSGGFEGTSMKPIWMDKRMTEEFGPAGFGWGMGQPDFQVVPAGEEIMVFCTVSLWYEEDGLQGTVFGVGGDKVVTKRRDGRLDGNDEAFKMAFTDALGNAMKRIGVGADIHMGQFEDNKYLREAADHYAQEARQMQPATPVAAAPKQAPAGAPAADPETQKLREAWGAISKAIPIQKTQVELDRMIGMHGEVLLKIKEHNAEGYEMLMNKVANRHNEILQAEAEAEQDQDAFPGDTQ